MAVSLWFSQASEKDFTPLGKSRLSIMIPSASPIFFYSWTQFTAVQDSQNYYI